MFPHALDTPSDDILRKADSVWVVIVVTGLESEVG